MKVVDGISIWELLIDYLGYIGWAFIELFFNWWVFSIRLYMYESEISYTKP
jgi:hypothetical protein